jgi:hypothetical protein
MVFQDGTILDTRDPAPLLTISVPYGLQMGQIPGTIQTKGLQLRAGTNGLFQDFGLVGGNVTLDSSTITAPGRRVELAGIAGAGTIGLTTIGTGLRLSVPDGLPRGDVVITNGSLIGVTGATGGSITIHADNLNILGGSALIAGIAQGLGTVGSQAGDITIDATRTIRLSDSSQIENGVFGGIGNSGNIQISGQTVELVNGSAIGSFTLGQGNAGNVTIQAKDTINLAIKKSA